MTLTDAHKLALVRLVHTLIYLVNGGACFVVLFAGLTGEIGLIFWISAILVAGEALILYLNGLKCPLSAIAISYGARETDFLYDTFLPEKLTRHTVPFFTTIVLAGLALLGFRWAGFIG
jgi:hypothetical protein